ncbi:hypothetical protein AMTRI_Chr10g229890 [Amborella trichopoda]
MGRHTEPTEVQSSIALLQERFRQLQRIKEMREEREFRRLLIGAKIGGIPDQCNDFLGHICSEPTSPCRPRGPLVHSGFPPELERQSPEFRTVEIPFFTTSRTNKANGRFRLELEVNKWEDTEVDTSLHL